MTTPPDDNDRVIRRLPWAVAIAVAVAVGLGWYGVTRLVGLPFDRGAVLFVVCVFFAVFLYATTDPAPKFLTGPSDAAPAVAPDDIVLPEERGRPIVVPLIGCLILGMGGCLLLGGKRPPMDAGAGVRLRLSGGVGLVEACREAGDGPLDRLRRSLLRRRIARAMAAIRRRGRRGGRR